MSNLEEFLRDFDLYIAVYGKLEAAKEHKLTEALLKTGREVRQGRRSWTKSDLVKIVHWKRLQRFHMPIVERNPPSEVNERLRLAFSTKEEKLRIEILRLIPGVGSALASAILAFTSPENYGVFDSHAWNALKSFGYDLPKKKPGDFNAGDLLDYLGTIRKMARGKSRTPRKCDMALYAYDKVETNKKWNNEFNLIRQEKSAT